jgi:hypothetical protein
MSPVRLLPRAFKTWLTLSSDAEVMTLLDAVAAELQRRGYVKVCSAVTWTKLPRVKEGPTSQST